MYLLESQLPVSEQVADTATAAFAQHEALVKAAEVLGIPLGMVEPDPVLLAGGNLASTTRHEARDKPSCCRTWMLGETRSA